MEQSGVTSSARTKGWWRGRRAWWIQDGAPAHRRIFVRDTAVSWGACMPYSLAMWSVLDMPQNGHHGHQTNNSPNYTFPNREPNEIRIVSRGESGWVVAESGWFEVNRSKFVVSRDDSWWFLADRELAQTTLKSLKLSGPSPESSWFGMIRGSSVAESGETEARSGWFVALSGKSALTRGSLGPLGRYMHADDSGVSRGRVGAESGEEVGAICSTIGYTGAESWHILV